MIFKIENAQKVEKNGFTAYVYNNKNEYPTLNTVYVDCFENHEKVYVKNSHRLYFVIEGEGEFNVGDNKYSVKQKDVILIEPMTKYSYKGKMKLFEINYPATNSDDEVKI